MNFDAAFDRLMGHEGAYSNNPADPGGETMHGITFRVARANGYKGPMRSLPLSEAKRIAKIAYWDVVKADSMPDGIRFDLFDAAYNSGEDNARKFLQRAAGVTADGAVGPKTMAAIAAMDPERLTGRFNGHRLDFLNNLGTWPHFGRGWSQRIAENLMEM